MPPESPRIAELRRRVQADPASVAFAQLAEECRRAGFYEEAVEYCRAGLARVPGYLSARVTLGRALLELGEFDEAARELEIVLRSAPDNLAAIRGMAEIHQRGGAPAAALEYYKRALALARFDPGLEESVDRISREVAGVASFEAGPGPSDPGASTLADAPATAEASAPAGAAPIDLDAVLAQLGAADAAPPPLMDRLLSDAPPVTPFVLPDVPSSSSPDALADLERELRAFDGTAARMAAAAAATPTLPSVPSSEARALGELEAWLRVLDGQRAAS